MSSAQSSLGFVLLCDLDGQVLQVFRNVHCRARQFFLSFVAPGDVRKAQSFLSLAQSEGAYDCNFVVSQCDQTVPLHFLAFRNGDVISMVGGNTIPAMNRVCAQLARRNRLFLGNLCQAIAESKQAEAEVLTRRAELLGAQRLAQVGSWHWDPATDVITWSSESARIAGCDPNLQAARFREHSRFPNPESWERSTQHAQSTAVTGVPYKLDLEGIRSNGVGARVVARGEAIRDAVIAEITDLQKAQEALTQEKSFTDAVVNTIPGVFFLFDEQGNPLRWNKRAEEITGYSAKEIAAMTLVDFHSGQTRTLMLETLRTGLCEGYSEIEANLRTRNGTEIPFYFRGACLTIESKRYLVGVGIDISERRRAETELRKLSQRFITAQEEERIHLARELHDDTSQRLALLAMQLEQLGNNLPEQKPQLTASLLGLHKQVTELAWDVHRFSRRLHPSVLDRVGIVPAIRRLSEDVRRQSGIAVRFHSNDIPVPIPEGVSLCLFRVVEEALNNAVKHSGASEVGVELIGDMGEIRLRVRDSGRGFEMDRANDSEGLGLISMKERLRLVGGNLSVTSHPNRGTEVEARVPLGSADQTNPA